MLYVNGAYQSTLLNGLTGVVHGFSSRALGDARIPANTTEFVRRVTGRDAKVVGVKQVHGADVVIAEPDSPRTIAEADGVVTVTPNSVAEVHVADCVPILLVDPHAGVAAAVHAGWRGTLAGIAGRAVRKMTEAGAAAGHIYAAIGPHIGRCCYTVGAGRAEEFVAAFGADERKAVRSTAGWHLDLGYINRTQLAGAGIRADHIDAPVVCTSCQVDRFFSYRRDTRDTFGEIIGIIGCTA